MPSAEIGALRPSRYGRPPIRRGAAGSAGVPWRHSCPWNAGAVRPTLCSRNSS